MLHRSQTIVMAIALTTGLASLASAAFLPGVHPFGNIAGTGTATTQVSGGLPVSSQSTTSYQDKNVDSTSFYGNFPSGNPPANTWMAYQETWATNQAVTTILVESSDRQAGGDITVATSSGGPLTTAWDSFNLANDTTGRYDAPSNLAVYGVRVETNSSANDYYQIGSAEIWTVRAGPNIVASIPGFSSPAPQTFTAANITDSRNSPRGWRANTTSSEQFVGVQFDRAAVHGIRVTVAGNDADAFGWKNFDVQTLSAGVWTTVGTASMAANENIFWGSFTNPYLNRIEGIRLYGSTANGNNPGALNGGLIVNEIQVYAPIPEPASLGLLSLAGLLLARRR